MADSSEGQMDGVSSSSSMMASPIANRSISFMTPSPPPPTTASPLSAILPSANPSLDRLEQENRVFKIEIETLKLRIKSLIEENKSLRRASVSIQAKAEQEEEFISNTLLKRIQILKKEKETLALNYEHEEECLTNDLSRKLNQLRAEKVQLEHTLEQEQEALVNKLMRKIEKLENETVRKQSNLEQLRREKIELENTLEQEQEALVNKLWKRMDKLETEKRDLHDKLETLSAASGCSMSEISNQSSSVQMTPAQSPGPQPMSPATPSTQTSTIPAATTSSTGALRSGGAPSLAASMCDPAQLSAHVKELRSEVVKLRNRLQIAEQDHSEKMALLEREEREQREQNVRLRRKLQMEIDRRERLCRHLSESESSLEIDFEDRHQSSSDAMAIPSHTASGNSTSTHRQRTLSSPVPMNMAMSPPASKAPPPTPLAISSPINQEHLMPRPISPISRQKSVCCPKCGHFFLASIGSYTNLFANSNMANSNNSLLNSYPNNSSSSLSANTIASSTTSPLQTLPHHHMLPMTRCSSIGQSTHLGTPFSIEQNNGGSGTHTCDHAMQEDNLSNSSSNSNSQNNIPGSMIKQQSSENEQMGTD
ncbi:hypothetical protein RDWZM_002746 [Blomia tropicalis]|uniref:Coiled-coil domain-containing protein 6 n=1 Tax=Blomia tropicalis TaxID=40697 RepID=A0A9Q0RSG2_BLOTA|nr:hypothetical protein RDWZM_002746 [Blomia tropicalis]